MDAPRLYPMRAWKRLGHRCDNCQNVVPRGELILLSAKGETFCSHLCEAIYTVNDNVPVPYLAEATR